MLAAMVCRTENDCFVGTNGRQVQDRAGAGEHEDRPATGATTPKISYRCILSGLVQPLFDHVDDHDGRTIRLQTGDQRDECARCGGSVLNHPGQRPIDPRLESKSNKHECLVGFQTSPANRKALGNGAIHHPRDLSVLAEGDPPFGIPVLELRLVNVCAAWTHALE
jgi:hypothetical protein